MLDKMLAALVAHQTGRDVAINGHRLVPGSGYVVEYEHWGPHEPRVLDIAFFRFNGKGDGGFDLQFTETISNANTSGKVVEYYETLPRDAAWIYPDSHGGDELKQSGWYWKWKAVEAYHGPYLSLAIALEESRK